MTIYYRIDTGLKEDYSPERLAALQANGKASRLLRLWAPVAAPAPGATQRAVEIAPVVNDTTATQTWQLMNKSAHELESESLATEVPQFDGWLTDIETQLAVTNNMRSAMTTNQRLNELEKDSRILLRMAKRFVRQQKQGVLT